MKEKVFSVLLLVVSVTVSLLIAEVIAKKVVESSFVYWSAFVPDDRIGWRLKPDLTLDVEWYQGVKQRIVSNRLGYRDSKNPTDVAGSTVVSIQGDSNLLGYGIQSPNLLSTVLDGLLNKEASGRYAVINAGTSGYDLQNYVLQFPELQKSFAPKLNFVFFNMDNDHLYTFLSTPYNLPRPFHDLKDGRLVFNSPEYRIRSQLYPLKLVPSLASEDRLVRSYYFGTWKQGYVDGIGAQSFLAYLIGSRLGYHNSLSRALGFHANPEAVSAEDYAKGFIFSVLSRYQERWDPAFDRGQRLIEKLFGTYTGFTATKTVVVLLPDKMDLVDRNELDAQFAKYNPGSSPKPEPFYEQMKRSITKAGLEYIDLRPIFLMQKDLPGLYLAGNSHIGPKGHEVIANVLADYVRASR